MAAGAAAAGTSASAAGGGAGPRVELVGRVSAPVSSGTSCPGDLPNTTQLAIDPVDGSLAAYYTAGNMFWPVVARSADGGRTWARTTLPTTGCAGYRDAGYVADPYLAFGRDGKLVVTTSWINDGFPTTPATAHDHDLARDLAMVSTDGGATFTAPVDLESSIGAQRGQVAPDPANPHAVLVSYERLRVPNDGGTPLLAGSSIALRRTTDGTKYETLSDPYDAPDGAAVVTVGVAGVGQDLVVVFAQVSATSLSTAPFGALAEQLLAVHSTDGGHSWSEPATVGTYASAAGLVPDPSATNAGVVPGCCIPDFVVAPDGTVYVAWSDAPGTTITIASSRDAGRTWAAHTLPVSGGKAMVPAIAVTSHGTVAVLYDLVTSDPRTGDDMLTPTVVVRTANGSWQSATIGSAFDGSTYDGSWDGTTLGPYQDIRAVGEGFLAVPVLGDGQVWLVHVAPGAVGELRAG